MRIRIDDFQSRQIFSACTPFNNLWRVIQESVAEEFNCDPDSVDSVEDGDEEFITVDGIAVARIVRDFGMIAS